MSHITIRKVRIGDEKDLAYIQTESWKKAFSDILSKENLKKYTNVKNAEKMYGELLKNDIGNGIILLVDDIPHCIAYWDKARDEYMSDFAELICIHSLQDKWGKGYGSMAMEYILNEIQSAGYSKIMLWVFEKNTRARKFYEKYGFVLTDRCHDYLNTAEIMYAKEF